MSSALYLILLFSALWTLSFCGTRQFHVVNETKNWTDAQKYCRENFTDLATIESQEEMNALLALVNKTHGYFWIGLRQKVQQSTIVRNVENFEDRTEKETKSVEYIKLHYESHLKSQEEMNAVIAVLNGKTDKFWIGMRQKIKQNNISWIWSDGSNSSYTYWNTGEPNNGMGDHCVQLWQDSTHKWNDDHCTSPNPFVCYKELPLILINQNKTWREALRYCKDHHVDLVSVHTEEIQRWVETAVYYASTANVWMGLRHTCTLSFWFWVNGESMCYDNWAPGNGTGVEDCSGGERTGAVQSGSKKWVSLPEDQELNFICAIKEF